MIYSSSEWADIARIGTTKGIDEGGLLHACNIRRDDIALLATTFDFLRRRTLYFVRYQSRHNSRFVTSRRRRSICICGRDGAENRPINHFPVFLLQPFIGLLEMTVSQETPVGRKRGRMRRSNKAEIKFVDVLTKQRGTPYLKTRCFSYSM